MAILGCFDQYLNKFVTFGISYCDETCISYLNITSNPQNRYKCLKLAGRFFQHPAKKLYTFGHAIETGITLHTIGMSIKWS